MEISHTINLFISGWAGFKEALGDIPSDWIFINPFFDYDEEEILNFIKNKSGNALVGWSTGGHIILKNMQLFSERFKTIVVVAGFKRFTDYVSKRVIERMIKKIKTDPDAVVKEFLINAGCNPVLPDVIDKDKLIRGLIFLLSSDLPSTYNEYKCRLIFLHGLNDKILPLKALHDLKVLYPKAEFHTLEASHWIQFSKILMLK